jgi:hypothetical protein
MGSTGQTSLRTEPSTRRPDFLLLEFYKVAYSAQNKLLISTWEKRCTDEPFSSQLSSIFETIQGPAALCR